MHQLRNLAQGGALSEADVQDMVEDFAWRTRRWTDEEFAGLETVEKAVIELIARLLLSAYQLRVLRAMQGRREGGGA